MSDGVILDESRLLELLSEGKLKTNLCRLCLSSGFENMFDIRKSVSKNKLKLLSSILEPIVFEIDPDDKYSDVICGTCLKELKNIFNFKTKCQTSFHRLNYLYENVSQIFKNMSKLDQSVTNQDCIVIIVPKEEPSLSDKSDARKKCLKSDEEELNFLNKNRLRFMCEICLEEFSQTESLQTHLKDCHNVENCDKYCVPRLTSKSTKRKKTKCLHCGVEQFKGFHSNAKELKCDKCDQKYPCEGLLQSHIDNIHSGDKLSKEVASNMNHWATKRTSAKNEDSLNCEICNRIYFTVKSLHKHMSTHYNIFICDYCSVKYTLKDNLRRHILTKHLKKERFICDVCQKGFLFVQDCIAHRQVHTKEKTFQCHVCGKDFAHKKSLTVHLRFHAGEKPFACESCDDKFVSLNRLNEHVQSKHLAKLECPKCFKQFTRKCSVTKHLNMQRCTFHINRIGSNIQESLVNSVHTATSSLPDNNEKFTHTLTCASKT